jgi:hemerythrin-like domain-containing protein
MIALDTLKQQHREIQQLLKRITAGNSDRAKSVAELTALLRVHTRLEESILYPTIAASGTKRAADEILESYEEHRIVDFLLASLPAMDDRSEEFLARARVLQSLIQDHVDEEENEVFKHAEALDEAERDELDRSMADEMREIEQVDELLARAATVARRTERWASALLDAGLELPRRAVRSIVPSAIRRSDQRYLWAARIATSMPRVVVDSLYRTITRSESSAHGHRAA